MAFRAIDIRVRLDLASQTTVRDRRDAVTYTCAGATYPGTLANGVVVFTAPSNALRADDCAENVTLPGGRVVSKRV